MEEQLDKLSQDLRDAVYHLAVAWDYLARAQEASQGTEHRSAVDHYYRIVKQAVTEVKDHFVREGLL